MKILPVTFITPKAISYKKQEHNSNPINYTEKRNVFAYQDYNISFMGRTPEDFYAQDFNRDNMPETMKEFLFLNYSEHQKMPPQQMMAYVFGSLEELDNFEAVKKIFKDEEFKGLHENETKSRKGILKEIADARVIGDGPILKDEKYKDNFGMYLLRKIYIEGKTTNEINADFYNEDMSDEYKGVITLPITNATFAAYGIKFPKLSFFNSLINTREEYKNFHVALPEEPYIPGGHTGGSHRGTHSKGNPVAEDDTPRPRKFQMETHHRRHLTQDIKNNKTIDSETVTRSVRKRFGKDDPQASFIIKYMSPIMTVAAERIHLSEEMKLFAEVEKMEGRSSDEKTMFGRFWKQNPELLAQYSQSITDTIDMFEDIYGGGGNIAINSNLEQINPKDPNNKILDFVSDEFLELLTYAQSIEGNRNARYAHHDHIERLIHEYSIPRHEEKEIKTQQVQPEEVVEDSIPENAPEESLSASNSKIYKLKTKDGNYIDITENLDNALDKYLAYETQFMPSKYAKEYVNFVKKHPSVDERYKLTLILPPNTIEDVDDSQIMTMEEFMTTHKQIHDDYLRQNIYNELCANATINDFLSKRFGQAINNVSYKISTTEYPKFLSQIANPAEYLFFMAETLSNRDEIDKMYKYYTKPLTKQEINKVSDKYISILYNYKPDDNSVISNDEQTLILMLKDSIMKRKNMRDIFRKYLKQIGLPKHTYTKSLLDSELPDDKKVTKFELSMLIFINDMLYKHNNSENIYLGLITRDTYEKYKNRLTPDKQYLIENKIESMRSDWRYRFERS